MKNTEFFTVAMVSREDVAPYIGKAKAKKLTDQQMERLARKMGDYLGDAYHEVLDVLADGLEVSQ